MTDWTMQDAETSFPAIADAALTGDPQHVACDGASAVVVLSADEYARLCDREREVSPTHDSEPAPENIPTFIEHLLAMPQDDGEFERIPLRPREVEF